MPRKPILSENDIHIACKMYNEGKETIEIAHFFNCSNTTISKNLSKNGVKFRTPAITEEGRQRMSEATKQQWRNGKKSPTLGYKYTDEQRKRMATAQKGEKSPRWNGGKRKVQSKNKQGYYVFLLKPEHPSAQPSTGYIAEHRFVMEEHLGRQLQDDENVHHINGVKHDNRIENLAVVKHSNHYGELCCPHCHQTFKIK